MLAFTTMPVTFRYWKPWKSWTLSCSVLNCQKTLERKFGGQQQQMAIYLEELENLRPVRLDNSRDLETFADIPDINIIKLKENGNCWELGDC